ncbi:hypothetical protein ZOSMA_33G00910 [Zostera marina]|uniref:Uncharacterized protein n=1 Tax=Zostera marina TaxID=29655 RepID=A0A0K9P7U0_ZOSMR|nr:hypothetical protein ZOSMA_33G00910 [Zostera marina]
MQIKVVPGNSAGTVTSYYICTFIFASFYLIIDQIMHTSILSSSYRICSFRPYGDSHDEIDFEFLGNLSLWNSNI